MHRIVHPLSGAAAVVAAAALIGCGTRNAAEPTQSGNVGPAPSPKAVPTVELAQVRYDALADAIQKQKGKVVVIDMWATW